MNLSGVITSATEGEMLHIRAELSHASADTITVPFFFTGEALPWHDFIAATNPIFIPPGDLHGDLFIDIVDDNLFEGTEEFQVELLVAGGGQLGNNITLGMTVLDNEVAPPARQRVSGYSPGSGKQVTSPFASPGSLKFDVVDEGQSQVLSFNLQNPTPLPATISTIGFQNIGTSAIALEAEVDGTDYAGAADDVTYNTSVALAPGAIVPVQVAFEPDTHGDYTARLEFGGSFGTISVLLEAISGFAGDPFLHPVINIDPIVIDYNADGIATVVLDGAGSHTHEPGKALSSWFWIWDSTLISSQEVDTYDMPLGEQSVTLTIFDTNEPPRSINTSKDFTIVPVDTVPGVMRLYYKPRGADVPADLLDDVPSAPDHADVTDSFELELENGFYGTSPYNTFTMIRMLADVEIPAAGTWKFKASGGVDRRVYFDGALVTGTFNVTPGTHSIDVRYALNSPGHAPLSLLVSIDSSANQEIAGPLVHDQSETAPVIHTMPQAGTVLGGNQIVIEGFGFFPQADVEVHWGNTVLTQNDFLSWSADRIELLSPPGSAGSIDVTIQTPNGTSNPTPFEYQTDGPVPINFSLVTQATVTQPTASAWGPDQRLYTVTRLGNLVAITFGDDYSIQSVDTYPGVSGLTNHEAMGLAFSPFEGPSRVKVYVAHTEMYAQGGLAFSGPSPYPGQISVLQGPDFDSPLPLITNLPSSNHDHGINGMMFTNSGDLLFAIGGNTNAGVKFPAIGDLPESPLTGAIVRARLSDPNFNGAIDYFETVGGALNNDQVFGDIVDIGPGVTLDIWASGLRNCFDFDMASSGLLYATDNGPNLGFGLTSTGPDTDNGSHANGPDELLLLERDHYYGHPNRSRGRQVGYENVYFSAFESSSAGYTAPIATMSPSVNGIAEYRAEAFGGQMKGNLLTQKYNAFFSRVQLSNDGRGVSTITNLSPISGGLGLETGPGGAIVISKYSGDRVQVYVPNDIGVSGMTPYDITPWRAVPGTFFVIGGHNFGSLGDTTVTIGGVQAQLTAVSSTRIRGTIPVNAGATNELVDVAITSNGETRSITEAFRWINGGPEPGVWEQFQTDMPLAAGEVASAEIDGLIYLVGEGNDKTYAYDVANNSWDTTLATRPFVGHHHASEVIDGKWYLIGGLGAGDGKVQIYDPILNSWTLGADLPWAAGSLSSVVIDGLIYASGGIVGTTTVDRTAVYDPLADSWLNLADMPVGKGRNHAAAATDGERFFIFGGRGVGSGAGNVVADGFDDVQIYDPQSDTWEASFDVGSTLAPLPIGRGGTGKAVYFDGEFYVFGGETLTGPGAVAGNVYDRVDVYNPATNTWRQAANLPTARHGIFPTLYQGKIYVAGGGVVAGFSASSKLEVFVP